MALLCRLSDEERPGVDLVKMLAVLLKYVVRWFTDGRKLYTCTFKRCSRARVVLGGSDFLAPTYYFLPRNVRIFCLSWGGVWCWTHGTVWIISRAGAMGTRAHLVCFTVFWVPCLAMMLQSVDKLFHIWVILSTRWQLWKPTIISAFVCFEPRGICLVLARILGRQVFLFWCTCRHVFAFGFLSKRYCVATYILFFLR